MSNNIIKYNSVDCDEDVLVVIDDSESSLSPVPANSSEFISESFAPTEIVAFSHFPFPEYKVRFDKLKEQWINEIGYQSNPDFILNTPAYKAIIKMQYRVVPFLIQDMKNGEGDWFFALKEIIGVDPVKKEHYGEFEAMANDWIRWSASNFGI